MGNFKPAVERRKAEPLGDLLKLFVAQNRLDGGLYQSAVFAAWDRAVGNLNGHVGGKFFRDGILHITVTSSVVRSHLSFQLPGILDEVNRIIADDEFLQSLGKTDPVKQIKLH